jgi:hypothetical protein
MNARFFFTARRLPALLALGGLVLTGCFSDSGNNSSSDRAATLQGRVQGDNEGSSSGWEGTVITTHTIGADGSLGAARDSSNCGPDGRYTIETLHTGNQELIVRARRPTNRRRRSYAW